MQKTLELDSNYAQAHFALGMTYAKFKDYEKSVTKLNKAVAISNKRPVFLGRLGAVYANQRKPEEAKKLFAELKMPPVNNDNLYGIDLIKSNLGQSDEALNVLENLLTKNMGL